MDVRVPALVALLALAATPSLLAASPADSAPVLGWEEVSRRPHDPTAFTQGLLLDEDGRLFESTGRFGASTVREVDPASGEVLRSMPLPEAWFGEGLALVEDELVQLTWKAGIAIRRDAETFETTALHTYEGEGWGLCHDGERLVMSDGSDELTFRDAATFAPIGSVPVTLGGASLYRLNELECVEGAVWANVWGSDVIVRIDPDEGRVTGLLDLRGVIEPHPSAADSGAVLNGIAHHASAGTLLVTGKDWPEIIEIRILEEEG
jgi:glutamine cyclotransferase